MKDEIILPTRRGGQMRGMTGGRLEVVRAPDGEEASGDGSYTLRGRAVLYGQPVELARDKDAKVTITEEIAPGAFSSLMDADVHLLWGHDLDKPLARTKAPGPIGKLELKEDDDGILVYAKLNPKDPDVQRLGEKMRAGLIDQMSFWAEIGSEKREQTEDDEETRVHYTIQEFSRWVDVTVTSRGVYEATTSEMRSQDRELIGRRLHSERGSEPESRDTAGADDKRAKARSIEAAKAHARAARLTMERDSA